MRSLRVLALYICCVTAVFAGDDKADTRCDVKANAESGVIFVAVMLPESEPLGAPVSFFYGFRSTDDKVPQFWGKSLGVRRSLMFVPTKSDFDGEFGKMIVLKLKAGDYALTGWTYTDAMGRQWHDRGKRPNIPFRVTAGRATYLGSLEPQLLHGEDIFGRDAARAWPTASDQTKRDVSLFLRKCSQLDIMDVDVAPLDLKPWLP